MSKTSATARESALKTRVLNYLKTKGYAVKIHGNEFTESGTPDILACVRGRFYAFELKAEDGELSKIQVYRLKQIATAGGVVAVVTTLQQVKDIVDP